MDHELTHPETLNALQAFRELTAEDRQAIAKLCHTLHYETGAHIIRLGEHDTDVFFLAAGRAKATIYSEVGRQFTLQTMEAGTMFGELSALDQQPRSAYVIALEESLVVSMSAEAFLNILYRYPPVALATLHRLCQMVRNLSAKTHMRNTLSARARVCAELLRLATQENISNNRVDLKNPPTHAEIATFVGTSRETVSREIAYLKQENLFASKGRAWRILDVAKLAQMID
ncbi:MAG: Crp/Fnr family transcriptional regulator [Candidatus Competibacteraceae bacterium]|nr:Crp/Fnr family transcriptional regulator [Candidatus Competibacteraceae bacterium]MCB1806215.1 Crp/Fnr family transcriptional regulator [Candidatus Competibacteraceae bacterium]MCB1815164.1 Crp/Fnr family transcriptional regulator [Candidatus Competibacteraceae bacterium]